MAYEYPPQDENGPYEIECINWSDEHGKLGWCSNGFYGAIDAIRDCLRHATPSSLLRYKVHYRDRYGERILVAEGELYRMAVTLD